MRRLLAVLFVALLSACGDMGLTGVSPRKYSAPLILPDNAEVDVRFIFTRTVDEATKECVRYGAANPASHSYYAGCAVSPNYQFDERRRWLVIAVRPTGWNDQASLASLGHEVAHVLGAVHE
jgi:hypothetical protein